MTKRTAQVVIRNNTSNPIVAVGVVHKYSDDYRHEGNWGIVMPGQVTEEKMDVEYNTGFLTTGRDWWTVTWYSPDMKKYYYSAPENFRDIFDAVESVAPDVIISAAIALSALATGGAATVPAAAAAAAVSKATTNQLLNSEGTSGFKQHILREEDEEEITEIVINDDGSIVFKSKSGNSETGYNSKDVNV